MGKHAGDLYIKAYCGNVSSTEKHLEDCVKYVANQTITYYNSSLMHGTLLETLNNVSDIEISCTVKSNIDNSFGLSLRQYSTIDSENPDVYQCRVGVKGDKKHFSSNGANTDTVIAGTRTYSANTDLDLKIIREGNTVKLYVDNVLLQTGSNSYIPNYNYIYLTYWGANSNYSLNIKDFKVKTL